MELIDYYKWFKKRLKRFGYIMPDKCNYTWFLVFKDLTQAQKVWWHLKTFKKVTTMDVELIYFFPHPPGIIRDIREKLVDEGSDYHISNKEKQGVTVWGKPCKYYEYTLKEY